MANIAVVHVPFYSHIEAATRLSGALSRHGHNVIAWGPEKSRTTIEASGARFVLHTPEMPRVDTFMAHVAALAATTEEVTGTLVEQLHEHEIDLIIHDSQAPWARVAGDYLGLPRIVSYPMFPIAATRVIPSDTSDPDIRVAEVNAWLELCRATDGFGQIFYRWRQHRIKRKSGNVADFCRRWGSNYRYMVELEGDRASLGGRARRLEQRDPHRGRERDHPHLHHE